jgi:hypothetical protein
MTTAGRGFVLSCLAALNIALYADNGRPVSLGVGVLLGLLALIQAGDDR